MKSLILFFVAILFVSCSVQKPSSGSWATDIEYLKTELPKRHKNLFFKKSKEDFHKGLDQIKNNVKGLSDFEIAVKTQQLIAQFGDSHTGINYNKFNKNKKTLPIKTYWFKDGLYITKTTKNNEELLGKKITRINNIEIPEIIKRLSSIITIDNNATIKKQLPSFIKSFQLLKYFDIVTSDKVEIEFESYNGTREKVDLIIEKMDKTNIVKLKFKNLPFSYLHERDLFADKYFEKDKIYFVQYNKCWSKELEEKYGTKAKASKLQSYLTFKNKVLYTLREKEVDKLIFDMHQNSGGSSLQLMELINEISNNEKINRKGKLFVVIGRRTYSSAILNTIDFMKKTKATIIGEETSGKPNHYGEIKSFVLPFSKLNVRYSTKYFQRLKNDPKTITPDVKIELTYSDFINGVDPVFEYVKSQK